MSTHESRKIGAKIFKLEHELNLILRDYGCSFIEDLKNIWSYSDVDDHPYDEAVNLLKNIERLKKLEEIEKL